MALPKVCGIETEYGIVVRGAENNPVSASSMLINAYVSATARERGRIGWDFEDEHPANDARGFSLDERRDLDPRIHQGLEPPGFLACEEAHGPDLGDLTVVCGTTGRLQIEHAERHVVE